MNTKKLTLALALVTAVAIQPTAPAISWKKLTAGALTVAAISYLGYWGYKKFFNESKPTIKEIQCNSTSFTKCDYLHNNKMKQKWVTDQLKQSSAKPYRIMLKKSYFDYFEIKTQNKNQLLVLNIYNTNHLGPHNNPIDKADKNIKLCIDTLLKKKNYDNVNLRCGRSETNGTWSYIENQYTDINYATQ